MLQLYNALNHTDYTNPDDLIITTIEDVIYMGMKNNLSFLVANELNLSQTQPVSEDADRAAFSKICGLLQRRGRHRGGVFHASL